MLVGERLPVGTHDDNVPGGARYGRLACPRVGEAEHQIARGADLRSLA
jgi:hypothetical protein